MKIQSVTDHKLMVIIYTCQLTSSLFAKELKTTYKSYVTKKNVKYPWIHFLLNPLLPPSPEILTVENRNGTFVHCLQQGQNTVYNRVTELEEAHLFL